MQPAPDATILRGESTASQAGRGRDGGSKVTGVGIAFDVLAVGIAAGVCWWLSENIPLTVIVGLEVAILVFFVWRIVGTTPGSILARMAFGVGAAPAVSEDETQLAVRRVSDRGFADAVPQLPWTPASPSVPHQAPVQFETAAEAPVDPQQAAQQPGYPGQPGPSGEHEFAAHQGHQSQQPHDLAPQDHPQAHGGMQAPVPQQVYGHDPHPEYGQYDGQQPGYPQQGNQQQAHQQPWHPQQAAPQAGFPGGMPQHGGPQPGMPQQGGPQHDATQFGTPQHDTRSTPQQAAAPSAPTRLPQEAPLPSPVSGAEPQQHRVVEFDATASAQPETASAANIAAAPQQTQAADRTPIVVLPNGERIALHGALLVGRKPRPEHDEIPVTLADDARSISRSHLMIVPDASGASVRDLGSANGTRVRRAGQEHLVTANTDFRLELGDVICLGRFELELQ